MKSRISVELVPRNKEVFEQEIKVLSKHFPGVDTVNVPDIAKYELTALEAASAACEVFENCIPHIRACTVDRSQALPFGDMLSRSGIDEVLVIQGDKLKTPLVEDPCSTLEMIEKIRSEAAEVKIYAGLDQYRGDMEEELRYAQEKLRCGASGFFTQPFFDIEYLRIYMDRLDGVEVFWGVSPVVTPRSKTYWENINNVTFPNNFCCDLDWNRDFAREVLSEVRARGSNIYFMPIKTDIVEYLSQVI